MSQKTGKKKEDSKQSELRELKKENEQLKQELKESKDKRKKEQRIFYYFLLLLFTFTFAFSIYKNYSSSNKEVISDKEEVDLKEEEEEPISIVASENVDLEEAKEKYNNQDIVARLEIPDLFNVYVVQTTDNSYYLTHDLSKNYTTSGSEFMDYRNTLTDKQINIYGHNASYKELPFRRLENYLKEEFFENNPYIILQTENTRFIYKIFSFKKIIQENNEHMRIRDTGKAYINHLKKLQEDSLYQREVEFQEDSRILVLQTCSYESDYKFYLVSSILVKEEIIEK